MKKLNIGFLIISDGWGGAEESIYQLSRYLLKEDVEVSIFINDEIKSYYINIPKIKIYTLGKLNKSSRLIFVYSYYLMRLKLLEIFKSFKPDIINLNLSGSFQLFYNLFKMLSTPVVTTLHGSEIINYYSKSSLLEYLTLKSAMNGSQRIVSPSSWQIEKLDKKYKNKTIIIPNGVDTKIFRPIKIHKESNVVLFVGRLIELKGILELIEVAKLLPQYEFWFAGKGPMERYINLPNTKLLGFKTRIELAKLYNQTTICCFPSHRENMPVVGLEAMSCGSAVIGTKLGFSEYIDTGINGLIVSAGNIVEIKDAIMTLIEDIDLRNKIQKKAIEKTRNYDWGKIALKYKDLYKSLIIENSN